MKKIFIRTILLFCIGILIIFSVAVLIVADNMNKSIAKDNAINLLGVFETQMIDGGYKDIEIFNGNNFDELINYKTLVTISGDANDIRVTVIAKNGTVLADTDYSDPSVMESHSNRKEIISALNNKTGTDIRESAMLKRNFLYAARLVDIDGAEVILRVAVPTKSINAYLYSTLLTTVVIFVIVLIVTIIISRYAANVINKPFVLVKEKLSDVLNPKVKAKPISLTKHDDINVVLQEIDTISEKLNTTLLYKQEFFANASHELSTPLSSIIGYSEMLLTEKKHNENFVKTIHKEAMRMKLLIDDMLKISMLEENKEIFNEKISLKLITEQVVTAAEPKAKTKNIVLNAHLEDCEIFANTEKITEVISNLIDNAIKYTNSGGRVIVSVKEENDSAIFSVKDTGIGIPKKEQSRIFERFYRVDKSRSKAEGGTGLGLAIVKHICNYYNAPVKLQSKEGVGTEITVMFELLR